MGEAKRRRDLQKTITFEQLDKQLTDMAAYYDNPKGYNGQQKEILWKRLNLLTERELINGMELTRAGCMKFPDPNYIIMATLPMQKDAAERKKAQIIQQHGRCKWCQSTGMIIVFDKTDTKIKNHEVTMRCGECQIAELTGVLRHGHAWTDDQMSDFEPTILEISMNANPTKGRLDQILEMPALERFELLHRQPWLKMALMFYGVDKRQGARQKQPNP